MGWNYYSLTLSLFLYVSSTPPLLLSSFPHLLICFFSLSLFYLYLLTPFLLCQCFPPHLLPFLPPPVIVSFFFPPFLLFLSLIFPLFCCWCHSYSVLFFSRSFVFDVFLHLCVFAFRSSFVLNLFGVTGTRTYPCTMRTDAVTGFAQRKKHGNGASLSAHVVEQELMLRAT